VRGAPGNWAQLQRATRALADARDELGVKGRPLRLRANTVLMHDNLPMFPALCHTLADWGVVEITFNQLGGRDRPEFFPAHRLRPEDAAQLAALVPPLRDALAQRGVKLCGSAAYLKRIEASVHNQRIEVTDCAPGERFLFLDESGRLAPCSFSLDEWSVPMAELSSADDLDGATPTLCCATPTPKRAGLQRLSFDPGLSQIHCLNIAHHATHRTST
jgi:hypothetical protein